jgi:deoxyadenosine/deoxycytidine kinase
METLAMACRVQQHMSEQDHPNPLRVMERSIYSGHYAFATNSYQNGSLSQLEWNLYLEWFNFLVTSHCKAPQGFIYLHVDPEVAYERIKKRNRSAEKTISLDYIKQIHERHQAFLVEKRDVLPELRNVPVLILDCNKEFELDPAEFYHHAQAAAQFMNAAEYVPAYINAVTAS